MKYSHTILPHTPVIFETMIFDDGARDGECVRYTTLADALAGHAAIVDELTGRLVAS